MERIGLVPGTEVGGYTVVSPLGTGGMGTVYRALDGEGVPVALKLLHPETGADPVARARLTREVQALQRLRHPGVARVLDAEADSSEAFLVTELIDGLALDEHVRRRGPLDPEPLAELAADLAGALAAVHEAGVVHRDLKPSNVMMSGHGPVLIDFGIASTGDTRVTSVGLVAGTPGYLAPELVDGAEPGPASDHWGLAAVLAFAATGRPPFGSGPFPVVLARSRAGTPDLDGLGRRTAAALSGALAPDPSARTGLSALVDELRRAASTADDEPASAVAATVVVGAPGAAATQVVAGPGDSRTQVVAGPGAAPPQVVAEPGGLRTQVVGPDGVTQLVPPPTGADASGAVPAGAATQVVAPPPHASAPVVPPPLTGAAAGPVHDGRTRAVPLGAGTAGDGLALDAVPPSVSPGVPPVEPAWTGVRESSGSPWAGSGDSSASWAEQTASAPAWAPPTGTDPSVGDDETWIEEDLDASEGDGTDSGYQRPHTRRRWGTVLALALLVACAGALYPGWTLVVALVLIWLVRTVGSDVERLYARREQVGVRRGDRARASLATPWHLIRALVGLVPSVLVSACVAVIAVGVAGWLIGTGRWAVEGAVRGQPPQGSLASVLVGGGVLVLLGIVWFGPLSVLTRIGARRTLAALAPGRRGALVVVLLALAASAVLVRLALDGQPIDWTPLPAPILPEP